MFDLFDSDWIGNVSDLGDAGDVAGTIGNAVSNAYGALGEAAPSYTEFVTNPELAKALDVWNSGYDLDGGSALPIGSTNDGITGIGWIDKVLGRLGDQWDKDPLSMIGAGVGILGKIDAIRQAQGHKPWLGGHGGGSDGGAEASASIRRMDDMMGGVRNAGASSFNSMANRLPVDTQIPIAAPVVLDPALYIQQGALSKIKR